MNPHKDKQLCERLTKGQWTWINANHSEARAGRLFAEGELVLDADPGIFFYNIYDVKFIAQARALLPEYIAKVEAQQQEIVRKTQCLEHCLDNYKGALSNAELQLTVNSHLEQPSGEEFKNKIDLENKINYLKAQIQLIEQALEVGDG